MPSPPVALPTTTKPTKLHLAFLPTSNDTLYSTTSPSYFSLAAANNDSTSNNYLSTSSPSSSKANSPMSRPPSLPRSQLSRERSSAAATQATVTQPTTHTGTDEEEQPDPTDEIFWYNLHMETLANFERERTMWRRMTEKLTKEVERLRGELQVTRARVVMGRELHLQMPQGPQSQSQQPQQLRRYASGPAGSTSNNKMNVLAEEGTQEDDKVFLDQQIIDQAHARLRELSVMSPSKEVGNPFDRPSPTEVDGVTFKRPSAPSRQTSHEDRERTGLSRKVTISYPVVESISEAAGQPHTLPEELGLTTSDPASPPQTARAAQSPPPHNFIMHAGHTPISVRARIARDSLWSRLATQSQDAELAHSDELGVTLNNHNDPAATTAQPPVHPRKRSPLPNNPNQPIHDTTDSGDIPLKSPKMLPTCPTNPSTPDLRQRDDPFAVLALKLEAVANDPKKAVPEVLKHTVHVPSDELGVSHDSGQVSSAGLGEQRGEGEEGEQKAEIREVGAGKREEKDEEEDEAGEEIQAAEDIVIKTRKSLNFGSQLGKLR